MVMTRKRGDTTAEVIMSGLKDLDGVQGKTGWFETAHYEDGTPVAYVATIHEFGAGPIPARPFMRPAVADHYQEWMQIFGDGAKAVIRGDYTASQVLELVTNAAASNVAEKIVSVTSPPLSQTTLIARYTGKFKGGRDVGAAASLLSQGPQNLRGVSTKPLVDTGQMFQSVTGVVEKVSG